MARIYVVLDKKGQIARFVRANTLNAAVRAHAAEKYTAVPASTEDIYQAVTMAAFDVLDAVAPEQLDIDEIEDEADPGPVPARVA